MAIAIFFISHWFLSLFMQTFFLHRYASHGMFTMSKFAERVCHLLTFLIQGSSYINPRAYAIMHRMHHAHSDTEQDPHSPMHWSNVFSMMWHATKIYRSIVNRQMDVEKYAKNVPQWPLLDKFADNFVVRVVFAVLYTYYYIIFATASWQYLLLPIHYVMGPIHGSIVNWFGHKYGYVNFASTKDNSKNTLPVDFLMLGELFQNNHHYKPGDPNFAKKAFEFDPVYPFIWFFDVIGLIKMKRNEL